MAQDPHIMSPFIGDFSLRISRHLAPRARYALGILAELLLSGFDFGKSDLLDEAHDNSVAERQLARHDPREE
jgi:hypothetical protein